MANHKSKPTHLKLLQGNPGKRAINKLEPIPEHEVGAAPEDLTEGARVIWDYITAQAPKGLIKTLDFAELKQWVIALDLYNKAYSEVKKQGMVVLSGDGKPIENPYLRIMNRQTEVMAKCGGNLGFNPTARTRIQIGAAPKKKEGGFGAFKGDDKPQH